MAERVDIEIKGRFDSKEIERGMKTLENLAKMTDVAVESLQGFHNALKEQNKIQNKLRANTKNNIKRKN